MKIRINTQRYDNWIEDIRYRAEKLWTCDVLEDYMVKVIG